MGRPGPQTMAKRQREREKAEKKRAKLEKRALRRALKNNPVEEPIPVFGQSLLAPDDADAMGSPGIETDSHSQPVESGS